MFSMYFNKVATEQQLKFLKFRTVPTAVTDRQNVLSTVKGRLRAPELTSPANLFINF